MPIITIKEQDNTRGGGTNDITDVVFLPGFGSHAFVGKDEDGKDLVFDDVSAWYGEVISDDGLRQKIKESMDANRAKPGEIKYCTTIAEFENYFGASFPVFSEDQSTEMELDRGGITVKYNFSRDALAGVEDGDGNTYLYKAGDIDPSYIMAREYINAGLPVYYVMLNGVGEGGAPEAPEAKKVYEYIVNELSSELSDKNEYSVKYITTGGYPTAEFGNCPDTNDNNSKKFILNPIDCDIKVTLGDSTDVVGEVKTIGAVDLGEYESERNTVLADYESTFKNSGLYVLGGACQSISSNTGTKWYIDLTNTANNNVEVVFNCEHPVFTELRDTNSKIGIYADGFAGSVQVPDNKITTVTLAGTLSVLPTEWTNYVKSQDAEKLVILTAGYNVDTEYTAEGKYTTSEGEVNYSKVSFTNTDGALKLNLISVDDTAVSLDAVMSEATTATVSINIAQLKNLPAADGTLKAVGATFSTNSAVASTIATLAETRGDAIAFIDEFNNPNRPLSTIDTASFYHNFVQDDDFKIKNTFATVIAGNHRVNCPFAGMEMVVPGSYCYLTSLAQSIKVNGNWLAVAGVTRGVVPNYIANASNYRLSNVIADAYTTETGVSINPITNIKPYGYTIWGNRTLKSNGADGLTATSFLNLRNLMCDVKKRIYIAAKMCMFEQNNDILWINFKSLITPTLDKLLTGYGISNYKIEKVATAKKGKLQAIVRLYPIYAVEEFEVLVTFEDEDVSVE